ncbi:MAG TPA: hypothetical protein VI142_00705, partial [Gaiellaceae bacterium]
MLLLALPLAVAVWAFGGFAAKRARSNADQELVRELNAATPAYARSLVAPRRTAGQLAASTRVARAFVRHDTRALRALERAHPWLALVPGASGGLHGRPAVAHIDVIDRGKTLGRVYVVPPFDQRFLRMISNHGDRLGFLVGGRLVRESGVSRVGARPKMDGPFDLPVGALEYRAVTLPLADGRDAPALITVRKASEIAAAADDIRWRVIGIGLGLIGAMLLTAYALAPAIARGRLSRQQRDQAERVL